ncbi:MAG: hypothetical protein PHP44_05460 [Kiritimatiellae bacterium]|nr:hypothetical protein [Kiritimatiellia bacterium]MDD4735535.1 hypothetical protein [Kiritimatiellia bacterium]
MMNPISSYDSLPASFSMQGLRPGAKPDQLREACEEAEGLFAGILLKEGLKPVLDEAGEGESHSGALLEFSIEEMAREMGRQGMLGIADQFYEQLTGQSNPFGGEQ